MILSFSKKFPWGDPTNFVEKIKNGDKIHTVRRDPSNRWREGNKIHFATGIRTKIYNQFHEGVCSDVRWVKIFPKQQLVLVQVKKIYSDKIGRAFTNVDPELFAKNDGFTDYEELFRWFNEPFEGKLISWTDYRY